MLLVAAAALPSTASPFYRSGGNRSSRVSGASEGKGGASEAAEPLLGKSLHPLGLQLSGHQEESGRGAKRKPSSTVSHTSERQASPQDSCFGSSTEDDWLGQDQGLGRGREPHSAFCSSLYSLIISDFLLSRKKPLHVWRPLITSMAEQRA